MTLGALLGRDGVQRIKDEVTQRIERADPVRVMSDAERLAASKRRCRGIGPQIPGMKCWDGGLCRYYIVEAVERQAHGGWLIQRRYPACGLVKVTDKPWNWQSDKVIRRP